MAVLLDTGILLRLLNRDDALHASARTAVRAVKGRGEQTVTCLQNICEFWNVSTRPASARGGLGLSGVQAQSKLRVIERIVQVLPEPAGLYDRWRELILAHQVMGVQVHDARIVASMMLHGVQDIITFNSRDFSRYKSLRVHSP